MLAPTLFPPIDFKKWAEENENKLQPPVNNYCIYKGDFIVMAVGGPNARTDYHINETEEWFYQHKGRMLLKVVYNNEFEDIYINEGEMFLLPASVPHNPVRFENTIGLVIERKRSAKEIDRLRWYCDKCKEIVYEESFHCYDLGAQLKPVIEKYANNSKLRVCKGCAHTNSSKMST